MFYSQLLLSKKGALGKAWLAAHYDKKLTRQQIQNTSVKSLVANVVKPQTALSLRVSAHLLLGLSKIFQRQVTYLFVESNDALVKIRAAFNNAGGGNKADGAGLLLENGEGAGADGAAVVPRGSKKGAGKGSNQQGQHIDASEDALRGNVDMAAGFLDLDSGFGGPDAFGNFGGDENNNFLGGEEWAAMGGGAGGRKGRGGVALEDSDIEINASGYEYEDAHAMNSGKRGGVMMTGTKSTGGRSSISDIEMLRRGVGAPGSVDGGSQASSYLRRGGALGSEAGDGASSIISGEDGYGLAGKRGLRRAAAGRLSTGLGNLEGEEYQQQNQQQAMELDADEAAMAAMMEGGSQMMMNYGGDVEQGGGYIDDMMMGDQNAGYGDYDNNQQQEGQEQGTGAAGKKKKATNGGDANGAPSEGFDANLGGYLMSEADIQAAAEREAEKQAARKAEMQKKRAERAAERKAKRDAAVAASSSLSAAGNARAVSAVSTTQLDAAVILKGDTIKTWLADTAPIVRPRRDLNDHKAVNALADRLRQSSLRAAEKKAGAVVSMMTAGGAMGAFSKELASTMATNPTFAAMRADQVAALPPVTGWDGLVLPPASDPALAAALAAGTSEATSSALLEERILQAPGAYSTSGVQAGLGLSSSNPEVSLLAAGNLHGRVKYPLAEAPMTVLQQQQQQQLEEAGQQAGNDEEQQQQYGEGGGYIDDMMMGDQNLGYGDYDNNNQNNNFGEDGLPLDGEQHNQQQLDISAQLLGPSSGGGLLGQSPAGLSTSTGASSSLSGNSKLGQVFARESLLNSSGGNNNAADVSMSSQALASSAAGNAVVAAASSQASAGGIESSSGKWHSQTRRMLEILASEMTGPVVLSPEEEEAKKLAAKGAGRKRKAAEMEQQLANANAAPNYDLSDLTEGKGTEQDPVSFLSLAADADASQVAVSFLHILQLKTWDIIHVAQPTPYEDVSIARTDKFATALADVRKGLH